MSKCHIVGNHMSRLKKGSILYFLKMLHNNIKINMTYMYTSIRTIDICRHNAEFPNQNTLCNLYGNRLKIRHRIYMHVQKLLITYALTGNCLVMWLKNHWQFWHISLITIATREHKLHVFFPVCNMHVMRKLFLMSTCAQKVLILLKDSTFLSGAIFKHT